MSSISNCRILENGVLGLVVPELRDYWQPTRIEDFRYIRPAMREQYLRTLKRRASYCERRIDEDSSMRKDWLAISELIELLDDDCIPEINSPTDRMTSYLADEFVCPMSFEKDGLVVAFDSLSESSDGLTHMGPLYLAKVLMEKIDIEMMLVGPANSDLPSSERGRIPTIQKPHSLSYSWAMHYETFAYYYLHRFAIEDHLRLLEDDNADISKNAGVTVLTALKRHFDYMALQK